MLSLFIINPLLDVIKQIISYIMYKIINYLYTLHISYIREIIIYIIMVQWSITLKSHFLNFGNTSNLITMYSVLCRVVVENWIFHHRCHESFCKSLKKVVKTRIIVLEALRPKTSRDRIMH